MRGAVTTTSVGAMRTGSVRGSSGLFVSVVRIGSVSVGSGGDCAMRPRLAASAKTVVRAVQSRVLDVRSTFM